MINIQFLKDISILDHFQGVNAMKVDKIKVVEELFQIHKVLTISELAHSLNRSVVTARRQLDKMEYFSSYTHNSRYYTVKSVTTFNENGIWHHGEIYFSKFGTLKRTIIHLINISPCGMTVSQIFNILGIKCYSHLNLFYKNGIISRSKIDKGFIYLAKEESIYKKQLNYYDHPKGLTSQAAIKLLVEYINNPKATYQDLSKAMNQHNFQIPVKTIELFFKEHGVKKTLKF